MCVIQEQSNFLLTFSSYGWLSPEVAAMLVHRIKEEKVFQDVDSIIMQNMTHNLLLFCAPTWPSYHVIENHLLDVAPNSNPLRLKRFAPSISLSFKCQCRIIVQMKRTKNLNPQRLELGTTLI